MEVSEQTIQAALAAFMAQNGSVRQKAVSAVSGPYLFGQGGLFGVPGLERNVISTRIQPMGLAGALPARGTNITDPLYPYITGFLDVTGSVAAGICDDPQTAGAIKNCLQTAQFGRYSFQTRTFELNRLGQQTNRGEFQDLVLMNEPLVEGANNITPSTGTAFRMLNEAVNRFVEVGVAFQNKLARQVYIGNPANNNAGGGYEEFPGLDILIGTTKVDAKTGTPCPSLRSDIKDFNYNAVTSSHAGGIVNVMTYMMRILRNNASRMNMGDTRWAIVMRETLFYELTAIWPCSYITQRCVTGLTANTNIETVNANDMIQMRDDMRDGNYLLIDGMRVPVILDDAIDEEFSGDTNRVPSGSFASDVYFIPLTVKGNVAVTFWEYFDYNGPNAAMSALRETAFGGLDTSFWTDGGRFLWARKPMNNWCLQWIAKTEPRLILLTPHLAGRLLNVVYTPLQHTRDAFPDQDYFTDGGVTSRSAALDYSDWNSTTPA